MLLRTKERGRPKKRKNLINERKKRKYLNEDGIEKSWTQKYVAEQIKENFDQKITPQLIGQIERGSINGSIKVLECLSKLYEKSIEELMS